LDYQTPAFVELLDGAALRRDLTALAHAETNEAKRRKAALVHVKYAFQNARRQATTRIENGSLPGIVAARAISSIHDALIQVLYDFATKHFYYAQNPTESERLAIVATGGYGRGLLAPFSDLDLLFLRPFKQTAWGESVIEFILLMLWDLGLKVGHATRSLAECTRLARDDMTIRTSLLETRIVWGEAPLAAELRKDYFAEIAGANGRDFVEAKLAERDERHRKQGESRYLVEPNVKEGKGGLRDLQTLYWMGKYLYRVEDPADLVEFGVFRREEHTTFRAAEVFLWNVRCQLHCAAGRAQERLTFDLQPELARRLGFTDDNPRRAVERFMRAYFLVAKDVGDLTRIFCAALEAQNRKPVPAQGLPGPAHAPDDDFFVENGRLNAREDVFARDPVKLIRIFHIANARSLDVHPGALRTIIRSLDLIDDELRADRTANRLFLEILTSRHDSERALRRMNEAGVLGRFVPAFGHAVALMQFNMYHHYTVDEHLIRAVGILAAIERGEFKEDCPLATDLAGRVRSRESLYCAVLLHDIAKGGKGSHSEAGAALALSLCPRFGLSRADTATTAWLVRNHLVMSDTAQRRDIADPGTIRNFVAAVQSPELLRLLFVLTVADIRAVGPGVWNGWKGQLLCDLYHEADAVMSGGSAAPAQAERIAAARDSLSRRLVDWPDQARVDALSHHQDNYWLAFDEVQLERHARLRVRARERRDGIALDAAEDALRSISEISICTPDRAGLFAMLAGAIAARGGSIVEAKAFTTGDGFALDVFTVQDHEGKPFVEPRRIARLHQTIAEAMQGDSLARPTIAYGSGKRRREAFQVAPRVSFDNDASAVATVVEVEGADRAGLLFDIARAMFEQHLSISSAIVTTYGARAVDVFYVRDEFGRRISDPARLAEIGSRLSDVL
jgi:[protein-PII] uridylyltransferase